MTDAQFVEHCWRCATLFHIMHTASGWECTPWLHILWYHSWSQRHLWGDLVMFGLWGLEAHKLLKRYYDVCIRNMLCHNTGENGPAEVLRRVSARIALKKHKPPHRPRAQRLTSAVMERVRARIVQNFAR